MIGDVSRLATTALLGAALALCLSAASFAQNPLDPLAGRTIRLIIGGSPSNDTDFYGRGFLEGLEAVLPQTTIRTQNVNGGGGSLALVEAMTASDGTAITIALVHSTPVYAQVFGSELAVFDLNQFHWIGAITNNQRVIGVRTSLGVVDLDALAALDSPLVLPAAGTAAETEATLVAAMTPLHLWVVPQVEDDLRNTLILSGDADLALGSYLSLKPLIDSGDLVIVLRLGATGYPLELAGVPTLADFLEPGIPPEAIGLTDSLNNLGRLVLAAPGTEAADVEALRAAFDLAMARPEVAAVFERQALVLAPTPGAEVERQMGLLLGSTEARDLLSGIMACGRLESERPEQVCASR